MKLPRRTYCSDRFNRHRHVDMDKAASILPADSCYKIRLECDKRYGRDECKKVRKGGSDTVIDGDVSSSISGLEKELASISNLNSLNNEDLLRAVNKCGRLTGHWVKETYVEGDALKEFRKKYESQNHEDEPWH